MSVGYETDRAWGERFLPAVHAIVGPLLLTSSPFELDAKRATDLIVLRAESVDIGVRVRRPGFLRYRDFTIRCHRDSGAETEASKVLRGFMRWFFYGWAAPEVPGQPPAFARWLLIDMNEFRYALASRGLTACKASGAIEEIPNGDGTYFWACDPTQFGSRLLVAQSDDGDVPGPSAPPWRRAA